MAKASAPFTLFGLSPALAMVIIGTVCWPGLSSPGRIACQTQGKAPLLALEVLDSNDERAAIFALLMIGALGPAINFFIPLYIQIVQGRTSLQTAVATVPYTLAIFASAVLIVRLYGAFSPRVIGPAASSSSPSG